MAFFYREGRLQVGSSERSVDVEDLAAKAEGPIYVYDLDIVKSRYAALSRALSGLRHSVHYAMKANSNPAIMKTLANLGSGVDTVSGGEIAAAMANGIPPERIIFSGVAKTVREIELALRSRIKQINVESAGELRRIAEVAKRLNVTADVAFRLNPDVNPKTHPYITTGFRENKFGMDESFMPELIEILRASSEHLRLRGLTMHIGSQLFDLEVLREAIQKTIAAHREYEKEGFKLDRLDIGGGLGVNYEIDDESADLALIEAYGKMVKEAVAGLDVELLTEPGRVLVGRCGILVGEVQYVKRAPAKTFAILDTGMHHLIRPALYSAKHRILPVRPRSGISREYDIVGPICESADFLAKSVTLPELVPGNHLAIADAGAYGFVMASRYNLQDLPSEIAVEDGRVLDASPATR